MGGAQEIQGSGRGSGSQKPPGDLHRTGLRAFPGNVLSRLLAGVTLAAVPLNGGICRLARATVVIL